MEIEWLKEGYYVSLSPKEEKNKFYKVAKTEAFDFTTGDEDTAIFSSVTSGSESGYKNITLIEPDDNPKHLFHVLWGVKDGCTYYLKLATGTNRLGVDDDLDVGYINNEKSPYDDPDPLYQFWLINEWYPAINAKNGTGGSLTPKVWFKGKKYDLEKVSEPNLINQLMHGVKPCRHITIGGVSTD